MTDRMKVGPADAETRKKMLRAELDRAAGGDSTTKKPPAAPAKQKKRLPAAPPKKRDLVRRYGPNGKSVDEVVDEAVSGAKLSY